MGLRVQGSGFRVQGSGFEIEGSGFRAVAEIGSKVLILIPMNSFKLLFDLREQLPQPRHALHGSASQPRHNPGESRFRVGRSTRRHPALAKQSTENRGNFEVCCDAPGVGGCRLEYLLLRGHVQPFLREKIHRKGLLSPSLDPSGSPGPSGLAR